MAIGLYSRAEQRRILSRWERSGLSAALFGPRVGLNASTLYSWRRAASPGANPALRGDAARAFLELVTPPSGGAAHPATRSHAGVEILLRHLCEPDEQLAVRLHPGFDSTTLLRVLDALRAMSAPNLSERPSPAQEGARP